MKWTERYIELSKADKTKQLESRELETFALAAFLTGKDNEYTETLGRAHQGYLSEGKAEQAVRCAFWLGMLLMNIGEHARGSGWLARGSRLLDEQNLDCAEKGLLLIPAAVRALSGGDATKAQAVFEEALAIGQQFSDPDLISLARMGQGQAIVRKGNVVKGIKLLDEVMVAVETEEIFPIARGIIYCAVIETCRKVWDLKRAREWTEVLGRWCDSQPDLVPFRGQCLVRRAEIMQLHGDWPKALTESRNACQLLTRPPGEAAAGEAYYLEAQLHRLKGDFEKAEDCYHHAAKWGRKPQPGLALLRLAQGQADAAETSIKNTLQETERPDARADLLPAVVTIMIAVEQIDEARKAAEELCQLANDFDVPYLYAMSSFSLGAVHYAEGNFNPAKDTLQKASHGWNSLNLPYQSARTKELKGLVYRKLSDRDSAEMEFAAAKWIFEQLKAVPDLERIKRIINNKKDENSYGLTLREVQVLRLVASGKTNKSVAYELFISERTVDRHVSNIFNKLGVSSRVAAAAFAIKHRIVENELF